MSNLSLSMLRSGNQLCFIPSFQSNFFDLPSCPSYSIIKGGRGGGARENRGREAEFLRRQESFIKPKDCTTK